MAYGYIEISQEELDCDIERIELNSIKEIRGKWFEQQLPKILEELFE